MSVALCLALGFIVGFSVRGVLAVAYERRRAKQENGG